MFVDTLTLGAPRRARLGRHARGGDGLAAVLAMVVAVVTAVLRGAVTRQREIEIPRFDDLRLVGLVSH